MLFGFDGVNALVRETGNGTMALSALLLVIIFAHFVWRNRNSFRHNATWYAACGLMVLFLGHSIRSGGAWVEFMLPHFSADALSTWAHYSWSWFIAAVVVITVGKSWLIYTFAPITWRWLILALGIPVCLLVPFLLSVAVRN